MTDALKTIVAIVVTTIVMGLALQGAHSILTGLLAVIGSIATVGWCIKAWTDSSNTRR